MTILTMFNTNHNYLIANILTCSLLVCSTLQSTKIMLIAIRNEFTVNSCYNSYVKRQNSRANYHKAFLQLTETCKTTSLMDVYKHIVHC